MAQEVVATFAGPLSSFSVNLTINNGSGAQVQSFGISGRTAKFPVTWDSMGSFSGPATLTSTVGVNTEVVIANFSGFAPGEQVAFSGIDPDFTGSASAGVRILDIAGSRAYVLFSDGTTAFGEFEATTAGTLRAVMSK
ncbi:hypothetical protein [Streptomyces xinghaiensis]|uniref:hypothetical protein n=1 Tax=Streptomyces xinghaiensis TaxID=1038928 RepID=UPI000316D402|nr:hypothetical protein [Streptomyces xinghaiensis]MZE81339.1 hypothetical protein [Streptomyces sp. SID5475]